jgi:hypothetical protein
LLRPESDEVGVAANDAMCQLRTSRPYALLLRRGHSVHHLTTGT